MATQELSAHAPAKQGAAHRGKGVMGVSRQLERTCFSDAPHRGGGLLLYPLFRTEMNIKVRACLIISPEPSVSSLRSQAMPGPPGGWRLFMARCVDREPVVVLSCVLGGLGLAMPVVVPPIRRAVGLDTHQVRC